MFRDPSDFFMIQIIRMGKMLRSCKQTLRSREPSFVEDKSTEWTTGSRCSAGGEGGNPTFILVSRIEPQHENV